MLVRGLAPAQVQDLALVLVGLHEVHMIPVLQVPLGGSCPAGKSAAPLSLVSAADLLRVHLGDKEPSAASLPLSPWISEQAG